MTSPAMLDESNCWRVSGVRTAEPFFRAIPFVVPDATHMFLEGSPDPDIVALISSDAEQGNSVGKDMSGFGSDDPREMPAHFFYRSLRVQFETAVRSDPDKQNCSICPRYWYVDAIFPCDRCGAEFAFTADEQRLWYEDYGFWVDSVPRHCLACRRDLRALKAVRQEYDQSVTHVLEHGDLESKKRLAGIIDLLYELEGELPFQINENRRRLANEIAKAESPA